MSMIHEREARNYVLFLAGLSVFLVLAGALGGWLHGRETQKVLVRQQQAMVSALTEQGVSVQVIGDALKNNDVTEPGEELMQRLGYTGNTALETQSLIYGTAKAFGIAGIAAALFVSALLLLSVWYYLEKRERLYREAEAVILQFAEGNFERHLPGKEPGAIYQLFHSIEQLATALQARNESEKRGKYFLKNTISDISHQLKTPLAALTMYTEIIQEESNRTEVVQEFSEKIMNSLERMEELIQSLLKVTRLDAGSILFEKSSYFLEEIVSRASEPFFTRAAQEGKQIMIQGKPDQMLCCDLQWTGEAVGNLIKNALDHTGQGGRICVSWSLSPAMTRITVSDNGCGIAQEDLYHIFKRFYRSKNSENQSGVGLGLPLAKAIVEGQGGVLSVRSSRGRGTVFTISFLTEL